VKRRIVLVDDHELVRVGVRSALGDRADVVGEAGDVQSAINIIEKTQPEVVLLDVHLPGGNGPAVIAGLPDTTARFLALSVSDAAEDVIAVIRAGARGYVTKAISGDDLLAAIERVAAGDAVFSPRLAGFVLDAFAKQPNELRDTELDQLTSRELEVLRLLARGYAYKEISSRLSISIKTVESHASAVLRKLQLSNRRELSRWAAERKLE
jgi:DNA-binding NarL/FixJ family response regulator